MKETKYQILKEIEKEKDLNILLAILELSAYKLEIKTISEMARAEGKSPNGINKSNQYRKLFIGGQKMCIKGLTDSNLPF